MAQLIKNADIFGRLGSGIGQGLAEQVPKEIERTRLASGLKGLADKKGLTPFQQYAELVGIPGAADRPQVLQTGGDLLRQQAIINSLNPGKENSEIPRGNKAYQENELLPPSATTTGSTNAALNPYIPPSGPEQENMARRLLANEPQIYRSIEDARSAIANQIQGNTQQSNALLNKRQLEESVQDSSEQKLRDELKTVGAKIPGKTLSSLQQKAVDAVTSGKMSPDQAKIIYGKEADQISNDFSNIESWGNLGLITKKPKDLINSMTALQRNAKAGGYQKQAADALISENGLTPQFAYATLYPVSDIKPLNEEIKALPNIQPKFEKSSSGPGLAGIGASRPKNAKATPLTTAIAPRLARAMGLEGSPLAISYELDKKGYDSDAWKEYLLNNQGDLNLTSHQIDELQKPKPSFFGWLNDWWLKSFTGVK